MPEAPWLLSRLFSIESQRTARLYQRECVYGPTGCFCGHRHYSAHQDPREGGPIRITTISTAYSGLASVGSVPTWPYVVACGEQ